MEAFPKLVLYGVPTGVTADAEIASRLSLWEQWRFAELLERVRGQASIRGDRIQHTLSQRKQGAAEARAIKLARENAKSKACNGLVGRLKCLSSEEQKQWAVT